MTWEVVTGSAGDEFRLTPRWKYRMTNITFSWNDSPQTFQALSNTIKVRRPAIPPLKLKMLHEKENALLK